MSYFIDAAQQVIEEEGIDEVTVRKVADIAGFNSATLYNYFENIDHLLFFACMKYLKDYAYALPKYLDNEENALDRYLKIWECFIHYAFKKPKIYRILFFEEFKSSTKENIEEYYNLFPEDLTRESKVVTSMLLENNFIDRNKTILRECAKEGYILEEDVEEINELTIIIFKSLLNQLISDGSLKESTKALANRSMKYMKRALQFYSSKVE